MAESGSDGEFRVTDRRRRAEDAEPPPAQATAAAQPPTAQTPPTVVEAAPRAAPAAAETEGSRPPERAGERSLEGLFIMLASSALVALGHAADPSTGQAGERDPAAASDAIELLVLLREKTEGHRTAREARLLDELISDLQLRYVSAVKPRL